MRQDLQAIFRTLHAGIQLGSGWAQVAGVLDDLACISIPNACSAVRVRRPVGVETDAAFFIEILGRLAFSTP